MLGTTAVERITCNINMFRQTISPCLILHYTSGSSTAAITRVPSPCTKSCLFPPADDKDDNNIQ